MSPTSPEPAYRTIYELIVRRLEEMGCRDVVGEIERTVRRGVVVAVDQGARSIYAGVRPMNDREILTIALEFLIAILQTPLMVDDTRRVLNCDQITWRLEEGAGDESQVEHTPMPTVDIGMLRSGLGELTRLLHELGIAMPEVA